ncbi:hypothetical protein [Streptomyces phaeochromogenes]|uniref:hypothetical protein n=1 Tax=Streptomyces phaeochromogenes TaxID=1923 RepID=UPI003718B897
MASRAGLRGAGEPGRVPGSADGRWRTGRRALCTTVPSTTAPGARGRDAGRRRPALADSSADARTLDELATFVVAVNQSLAVLSRAGTSDAELRTVTRLACTTVADSLARAASEDIAQS